MKPRLRSKPLTRADTDVWLFLQRHRDRSMTKEWLANIQADRLDAELMLSHTIAYQDIVNQGYPQYRVWHAAYAFVGIPIPANYCVYD